MSQPEVAELVDFVVAFEKGADCPTCREPTHRTVRGHMTPKGPIVGVTCDNCGNLTAFNAAQGPTRIEELESLRDDPPLTTF